MIRYRAASGPLLQRIRRARQTPDATVIPALQYSLVTGPGADYTCQAAEEGSVAAQPDLWPGFMKLSAPWTANGSTAQGGGPSPVCTARRGRTIWTHLRS